MERHPLLTELEALSSGTRSWPDSEKTKRHHYIPAFVLRNFESKQVGGLVRLDLKTGRTTRLGARDAAVEKSLYRVRGGNSASHNRVEAFLSVVENHAAPAVQRLVSDPSAMKSEDRLTIAIFVALQEQRSPGGLARIEEISRYAADKFSTEVLFDERAYRAAYRAGRVDGDQVLSDSEIEARRQSTLASYGNRPPDYHLSESHSLHVIAEIWEQLASMLLKLRWTALTTDSVPFVIGDRGLSMVDTTRPRGARAGAAWRSSAQAQTFVPLSPSLCLMFSDGSPDGLTHRQLSDRETNRLNLAAYGWANASVFGSSYQVLQLLRRTAKERPRDVPKLGPIGAVPPGWTPPPPSVHRALERLAGLNLGTDGPRFRPADWTDVAGTLVCRWTACTGSASSRRPLFTPHFFGTRSEPGSHSLVWRRWLAAVPRMQRPPTGGRGASEYGGACGPARKNGPRWPPKPGSGPCAY